MVSRFYKTNYKLNFNVGQSNKIHQKFIFKGFNVFLYERSVNWIEKCVVEKANQISKRVINETQINFLVVASKILKNLRAFFLSFCLFKF